MVSQVRSPSQRPSVPRARKARAITKPKFTVYNTAEKQHAMVDKRDAEVTKMYRASVTLWQTGAYEAVTLHPTLRACRPIELRAGCEVAAADGITDAQPVRLTVQRLIHGRAHDNPAWVVCNGVEDGKLRLIPVMFVGVPVPQVQ